MIYSLYPLLKVVSGISLHPPITRQNCTEEHIFLAGLGDKLKSQKLLCKKCNSLLGAVVDAPLINDMKQFVNFSMIKTREKEPNVVVTDDETGHEYLFNPSKNEYKLRHDYVTTTQKGNKLLINGEFRNDKAFQHYKKKLKKKYPSLDLTKLNAKHNKFRPLVNVNLPINPPKYVLAVIKMAIEFSLICGVPKRGIISLITMLRLSVKIRDFNPTLVKKYLEITSERIHPFISIPKDMKPDPRKMQAKLYSQNKTLYCWISILGLFSYTIPLNNSQEVEITINPNVYYYGDPNMFKSTYKNFDV